MTIYRAIQPTGASVAGQETYTKTDLFRAGDLACTALGLSDAVAVTLNHMIRSIPKSATAPICATALHILAEERGVSNRTIYNHIQHLVRLGLAIDRCEGGGRRVINRIDLSCPVFVPPQVLVWATFGSKATGLFEPSAECRLRGL